MEADRQEAAMHREIDEINGVTPAEVGLDEERLAAIKSEGTKRRKQRARKTVAKLALATGASIGLLTPGGSEAVNDAAGAVKDKVESAIGLDNSPESNNATYTVQPGDTAWDIAQNVEANQDGVADNQDVRPIVDDISAQAGEDGLQPGEEIQVPASADLRADIEGVQLRHK